MDVQIKLDIEDACEIVRKMLSDDLKYMDNVADDDELRNALQIVLNYYKQGDTNE